MAGSRKSTPPLGPVNVAPAVAPVQPPTGGRAPMVGPRGWYVFAWVDGQGNAVPARSPGAVGVMAVSVNRRLPTTTRERLRFMDTVVAIAAAATAKHPVFIALPAGFFGFDAEVWWEETGGAWAGLAFTPAEAAAVRAHAQALVDGLPLGSAIAFGSDIGGANGDQAACVVQHGSVARVIHRTSTALADRHVRVGPLLATVFICGEFTGSSTWANGPFHDGRLLHVHDLSDTGFLVDLAHAHVSGTVHAPLASPRNVHQGQMEAFSPMGASLLVHHHGGELTGERARKDAASNWVLFRGGQWIADEEVRPIP